MAAHGQELDRHVTTLGTWHYERPRSTDRPIPYTFTYKLKTDNEGQPSKYKARCAIRGDLMRPGVDFDCTRRAAHNPSQSDKRFLYADTARLNQGWGKIRPIRIRIRIREYSANPNFEKECIIRRIRIRILKLKFEFARIEFESNRTRVPKFVEYSQKFEFG
jgi:hypothetical protein